MGVGEWEMTGGREELSGGRWEETGWRWEVSGGIQIQIDVLHETAHVPIGCIVHF